MSADGLGPGAALVHPEGAPRRGFAGVEARPGRSRALTPPCGCADESAEELAGEPKVRVACAVWAEGDDGSKPSSHAR